MLLLFVHLLIGVAFAHPFGSALYGHQLRVWLDPDAVRVDYLAEVPTPVVVRDMRVFFLDRPQPGKQDQDEFVARWQSELEGGLRLLVDQQPVPWRRLPETEASGVGDSRFVAFRLSLEAPIPAGARTLQIANGNLPDQPSLFETELLVADSLSLDATSLVDVEDGEVHRDRGGGWQAEEEARELRLSFQSRGAMQAGFSRLVGRLSGADGRFVPAVEALSSVKGDLSAELRKGRLPGPLLLLLGLSVTILIGAGGLLWRRSRRKRT